MDFIKKLKVFMYYAKHTINLIFINILFVKSKVYYDLNNGSNHFTIIIIISDNSIMLD